VILPLGGGGGSQSEPDPPTPPWPWFFGKVNPQFWYNFLPKKQKNL
jgi:hypothetical protein